MRIAEGGLSWILTSFAIAFLLVGLSYFLTGIVMVVLFVLSVFFYVVSCLLIVFFRDPERTVGSGVVAVADGKIREITHVHDPDVGEAVQISTFMNIHNVHVNRMPLDGTITTITHYTGGHLPAYKKESERNERVVLRINTEIGLIKIIQIAGTVARRIVPYVSEGTLVKKGARIGLIRLGSRVDVFLPTKKIKVVSIQVQDKVHAGEDRLAEING